MIEGVSPLHIRSFQAYKADPCAFGWSTNGDEKHPLINRLVRKKYPILSRLPFVRSFLLYPDRYFEAAHFVIIGPDGSAIKRVICRSNAQLEIRVEQAQARLDEFLANIQGKDLTHE